MTDNSPSANLEVPEVRQLPELSGNTHDVVGFADMVLTSLLSYESAVLLAEWTPLDSSASWRIEPQEGTIRTHAIEVAISPSQGSFRAVLARFGYHYMGVQLYNGYALRFLRQRGRVHLSYIYMSNGGQPGFWIRIYATVVPDPAFP